MTDEDLSPQQLAMVEIWEKHIIVDELMYKFTHTIEMPWILPGIRPTGRRVEIAVVVVVQFKDGKIAGEHIYWDQASVLA
jgi:carboxymethylenebutenolidase